MEKGEETPTHSFIRTGYLMYCDGKIKDAQAGACLPLPSTHVRRSIQSDYASGATLRGFGFHQQSFPRGPPSAYWTKTRFRSTASLCQSRCGLNSFIPRLMTIIGFRPAIPSE